MAGTYNTKTGRWVQARPTDRERPSRSRARRLSDDELVAAAVADGRIIARRRPHYERLMAADRKGTRRLIASLAKGSPLSDADREHVRALAGDDGTRSDGSWITEHKRTPAGTIFDASGRVVVAGSPPPAAPRRPVVPRPVAAVADPPVATPGRSASAYDDDGWTFPRKPAKLRPGTVLDTSGRVVATAS